MQANHGARGTSAALAVLVLAATAGGSALAGGDEDGIVLRHKNKIKIVEVDNDEPRAFLGVETETAEDGGARVGSVVAESAAERAGLAAGDVIVRFDGQAIEDSPDLTRAVLEAEPGERVAIEIERDGRRRTIEAELGERDWSAIGRLHGLGNLGVLTPSLPRLAFFGGRPKLGVELVQPTPELREHYGAPPDAGVIVGKVLAGMPAEGAGVRVGDVIVSADGREIEDAGDLIDALSDAEGTTVELELIRDGRAVRLEVAIPEPDDEEIPTGPRA